ncbi:unnamed protein product (macronuclear) [Paramecium tetraurelia]|uniref:GAF domain-containing protein n=1 Tax=Paramecium tetraurelia TaxID=5888 RepID=A0DNS1_PARTE|nr:uncharacterized protein GSPATT00018884001 [Paramecium tetraurelia]CAK84688.1 unnamed protein product [Paramecium tetraurelia]|eukprot:XP_001452085.1 hypothetical protein (macronuclear) [Paramecium tetraurelia strain d4-2]
MALQDKGLVGFILVIIIKQKYRNQEQQIPSRCIKPQNISQKPKKPIIYRIKKSEEPEYGKNALILPIFCIGQNRVRCSLIILNSEQEQFSSDEECFGIIICRFLGIIIQRLVHKESWQIAQKYGSLMINQLIYTLRTKSKQIASDRIKLSFKRILGLQMIKFYFVKNESEGRDLFIRIWIGRNESEEQRSVKFYSKVDVTSILPIFIKPLLNNKDKVIGIVETCLKNKLLIYIEREHLLEVSENFFGIEEPLTSQLQSYAELLAGTLSNIEI